VFSPGTSTPRELEALRLPPDISLILSALTPDIPTRYNVDVSISPSGQVTHCEASGDTQAELVTSACELASQQSWPVLTNAQQQPVAYVRGLIIELETEQPAAG
jgi:hypothetical protein